MCKKCLKLQQKKVLKTYNNKRVPKSAKRCQKVPKKGQQVLKKENIEFILGNKKCQKVAKNEEEKSSKKKQKVH